MKKIFIILSFLVSLTTYSQQTSWALRNDSLFIVRGEDSIHYSEHMFFDFILSLKSRIANVASNQNNLQTAISAKAESVHAHDYSTITNLPTIPTNTNQLTNGASFITTAALSPYLTTAIGASTYQPIGSYAAAVHAHAYNTLSGIPATFVPAAHAHPQSEITNLVTDLAAKQATLVSATNIKTINGSSVLGSGDLVVSGSAAFSGITGQPTDNANLSTALAGKANVTTIGIPVYSRVTGSNVITTGQALTNIAGLSNALVANATYELEAALSVSTSAVTTGTAYGVNYSAAGATVEAHITGSSTSTASKTLRISALNTATLLFLATSAQTGGIVIKGIVTTGANAGNFTVSHLKLSSGTSTVFINSYLRTTRIL